MIRIKMIEGSNACDQIAFHALHSLLVEVETKLILATYISSMCNSNLQGPVVRKRDSAIHWIA